jgi:ribosome-associated heat shock protein Hsp15
MSIPLAPNDSGSSRASVRLDKWLWSVRLYKTRTLAAEACRLGKVLIGGNAAKPSRTLKLGDLVEARFSDIKRTVRVLKLTERRVGPKFVAEIAEDLTPAKEYLQQMEHRRLSLPHRPAGAGRPTKKERRELDAFSDKNREVSGTG